MRKLLENYLKFSKQRAGVPLGKQVKLAFKVTEFAARRALSSDFVMRDIWSIKHRYTGADIMGFKTSVGTYELEEQAFFHNALQLAPVHTIVDVGSAVGTFASLFSTYAPQATVFSFEPNPFSNRYQARQIEINGLQDRVRLYHAGLGSSEATMRFSYVDGIQGSLWGRFDGGVGDNQTIDADVKVLKLDDVAELQARESLEFVKLDIEGYELPALQGMKKTIERFKPVILCELALSFMVEYEGNRYKETFEFFDEIDYDVFLLRDGKLKRYVWPEERVMNLILLPRTGGGEVARIVRERLVG